MPLRWSFGPREKPLGTSVELVEYLESRLLKSQLNVLFKSYIALQILLSTLEYLEKVPRPLQHIMTQKYPTD